MIAAITLTLGWWLIPTIITIPFLFLFIKNFYEDRYGGWIDFSIIFNFLLLIPPLAVWVIYLGVRIIFQIS